MKVYIQTDVEGCAGFCFYQNFSDKSLENNQHYWRMAKLLTNEVNAAVKAAFEAGATEVIVNDSHGSGYNIIFEELDPRCEIIHGRNCSGPHWLPLLDKSFDAMILIGMHAMGETPNAVASHSKWEVNEGELYLSEGSMAAAIAGDHGVPTVFVSGDDKVTDEIQGKIPEIRKAVVKQSLGAYQAKSVIPKRACEMIHSGVKEALENLDSIPPYLIKGPVKLQLWESEGHVPPFKPVMPDAVEADTMDEAFMKYELAMPWTNFNTELADGFKFP